jgi:hypothetical protein
MTMAQVDPSAESLGAVVSDKGHWLSVRLGSRTTEATLGDRWIVVVGYEGRFSTNWSIPIEAQWFRDVKLETQFTLTAAIKLRVPFNLEYSNVYLQAGVGPYGFGWVAHYAIGLEYGILDRSSLCCQVKVFNLGPDLPGAFVSLGINLNATSE